MKKLAVLASVFSLLAMPVLARQYGPIVVDDWSGKFVVTSKGVPAGVAAKVAQLAPPAAPTPADIVWQSAPHNNWDTASQVVINGKPYYPESAEKPYSIQIAKNTTADLTRFEIRHGDLWTQALGGNDSERAELDGYASLFLVPGRISGSPMTSRLRTVCRGSPALRAAAKAVPARGLLWDKFTAKVTLRRCRGG